MNADMFLRSVITTPEGWFCLMIGLEESWYKWPDDLPKILEAASEAASSNDVYFSPHLFKAQRSTRANVLPSATIHADLDNANVYDPSMITPSILVESSPGRHQGYWILKEIQDTDTLERMSKTMTYSIPDCDKGCWQLGHKMRVPDTLNHKYSVSHPVRVVASSMRTYADLPATLHSVVPEGESDQEEWVPNEDIGVGPLTLMRNNKRSFPARIAQFFSKRQPDRSDALWALMCAGFRAGLDRNQVFVLAKHSANNKWADNKWNADRDLARDVLRAEKASQTETAVSVRENIEEVRSATQPSAKKKQLIAGIVRDDLRTFGKFVLTDDGRRWIVPSTTGEPVGLETRSSNLNTILESRYALNATETEQKYVVENLQTYCKTNGHPTHIASLSYYNEESGSVFLHTGARDVILINRHGISHLVNGQSDILFQKRQGTFDLDENAVSIDTLFSGCFYNCTGYTHDQAMALIKAWLYFLFFREGTITRPILALFGQPGSGKSTLFRRIYALIYGPNKALNSVTTAEDFDHAVSLDPFVVLDNVDTWSNWLPDKLALAASYSDLVKRKLYTDNDTVVLKRQALVGISAHNPKFRREDIVDRLILINFERLKHFDPETEIMEHIYARRNALWTGIAHDLQRILSTPKPKDNEIPVFRISDFARLGLWISRALGFEDEFRDALEINIQEQKGFNLEEEGLLIDSIQRWLSQSKSSREFHNASELYSTLSIMARDASEFHRIYRGTKDFGRKLWILQDTLQTVLQVETRLGEGSTREWRFSPK